MNSDNEYYYVNQSSLSGTVNLSGAKNSALKLLTSSLLTCENVAIDNYPSSILDAQIHVEMLRFLGKKCSVTDKTIRIEEANNLGYNLEWEGQSIRNTLLILGALVSRFGKAKVPLPGGCQIGDRKTDLHEMVLQRLGAEIWYEDGTICAKAERGLTGSEITLPIRSTGATENGIISSCLAEGQTTIWNPHIRPEILDLIDYLKGMGAKIEVFGQERIVIQGVKELSGVSHTVIPDNMEAITWLVASVITNGSIEIDNFPIDSLLVPMIFLRESGAAFYQKGNKMIVEGGSPYPLEISTGPYPGINSDMQPLFAVYGVQARGQSKIIDLRFPGRYDYSTEFNKMGANCTINGNMLIINGGFPLMGAEVKALDLRAGAALVLAGLVADNTTKIENAWQIERGYDNFLEKSRRLGAKIDR